MIENLFRPTHLILILIVALVIFGPGKLPQVGSALGKSIRDFKKSVNDPADSNGEPAQRNEKIVAAAPEEKQ